MFRFKQPSSGRLPFVLCQSYNSQLKCIVKDGSAVAAYSVQSLFCVRIVHCAECDSHSAQSSPVQCVYRALCRMWVTFCTVQTSPVCVSCTVQNVTHILHSPVQCVYRALCRMWLTFCTVQSCVCIVHCAECESHSAQCTIHTQNKDWTEYAATQPNRP